MDNLEKYFTANRVAFDDAEPMPDHLDRFSAMLDEEFGKEIKVSSRMVFMRIAAGFLILMTFSVFLVDFVRTRNYERNQGIAATGELQEAINYYDDAAASGLDVIKNLACCGKEKAQIYSMASGELRSLETNAVELKQALKANPGDERIQAALIRNQQMKEKVMSQMIDQMNKIKK